MTELMIYLIGVADNFQAISFFGSFLSLAGVVLLITFGLAQLHDVIYYDKDQNEANAKQGKQYLAFAKKVFFYCLVPSVFLAVFIPNSKTLAAMWLVPKITNNQTVQNIPDKALKVLDGKLDEWISDMGESADMNKGSLDEI